MDDFNDHDALVGDIVIGFKSPAELGLQCYCGCANPASKWEGHYVEGSDEGEDLVRVVPAWDVWTEVNGLVIDENQEWLYRSWLRQKSQS